MAYLEGVNAYFNKWPVHAIPFENMRKLSPEKYRQVVGEDAADMPLEMNMEDALEATPHELSLKDDEVIAFPKEIAYELRGKSSMSLRSIPSWRCMVPAASR